MNSKFLLKNYSKYFLKINSNKTAFHLTIHLTESFNFISSYFHSMGLCLFLKREKLKFFRNL